MKKRITFTRKEVIKALMTEPLEAGSWFTVEDDDSLNPFDLLHEASNEFCDVKLDVTKSKTFKTCNVCAVGSLIRSKSEEIAPFVNKLGNWDDFMTAIFNATGRVATISDIATIDADCYGSVCDDYCDGSCYEERFEAHLKQLLKKKNYLGALSSFFEHMMEQNCDSNVTKRHRNKLVKFVKENFPNKFTATLRV